MTAFEFVIPCSVYGRKAHNIVYTINSWNVQTYIKSGEREINASSIIGLLSLGLSEGDIVTVYFCCDKADENEYFEKFKALFE